LGTIPSSTKGSIKLRFTTHRAARSLRIASWSEGSSKIPQKNV
jgi:hypothetical protein